MRRCQPARSPDRQSDRRAGAPSSPRSARRRLDGTAWAEPDVLERAEANSSEAEHAIQRVGPLHQIRSRAQRPPRRPGAPRQACRNPKNSEARIDEVRTPCADDARFCARALR
jgi:hypothetical protein